MNALKKQKLSNKKSTRLQAFIDVVQGTGKNVPKTDLHKLPLIV